MSRVSRKGLKYRVKALRDKFGLPALYLRYGTDATEDEKRRYWPDNPMKDVRLLGMDSEQKIHALTGWLKLREMSAYLDGFVDALHLARHFEGLRKPGLYICNAWADFFFKIMSAEREAMAKEHGLDRPPAYPWKPQSETVPFGRREV